MVNPTPSQERTAGKSPGRMRMVRDLLVFQVKLFVDGLRDLLLSPISLIAGLIGLLTGATRVFYSVVRLGKHSERWIDLFAAARRIDEQQDEPEQGSLDEAIGRLEARIVDEYRAGNVSATARDTSNRAPCVVSRREAADKQSPDSAKQPPQ